MNRDPQKATVPQIRKIWVTAKFLDITEEVLRDVVEAETGQRHISALDKYEAIRVIDRLCEVAQVPGRASPQQRWLIKKLTAELGWNDNPARLRGFLKKYFHVENLRWLTPDKAWRVIEALKKLKRWQWEQVESAK